MAKWASSETGILRKKVVPERHEELLVFGYACKLFRDDEKALYIDQGKHLIPCLHDETLRVDRYDCRGTLTDLAPYEASREGYDAMRWLGLSEAERKIEQVCDEERYYALRTNEEEEELYKEEEKKRLQQKTKEFAYSYDVPQDPDASQDSNPPTVEEDREYVPPLELDVPADIEIPKTVKESTRIEKTAFFVSKQGPQMEILIKAKQADNPQFSFLNQSDCLYKFYKHVLSAIKNGRYRVETNTTEAADQKKEEQEHDTNDSYLHPSLLQTSVQSTTTHIPTIAYKPTADCSYLQLVNRIQGSQTDAGVQTKPAETAQSAQGQTQSVYEQQQQYYQYYYAMQYYEYYKQMVAQFHSMGGTDGQTIPPHIQEQINAQAATFAQVAYTQYVQQNSNNPYAQIVSNLSQNKDAATYTTLSSQAGDITKAPVIYSQNEPGTANTATTQQHSNPGTPNIAPNEENSGSDEQRQVVEPIDTTKKEPEALLSLANYGSESEDEGAEETDEMNGEEGVFKMPPDETKVIIDKMASYVSKNGTDFENIVKAKGDPRFEFLNDTHEYHSYYRRKIDEFSGVTKPDKRLEILEFVKSEQKQAQLAKAKEKKIITPVSFSIKKPKDEIPKDIKSALPVEESDDENPDETPQPTQIQPKTPTIIAASNSTITPSISTFMPVLTTEIAPPMTEPVVTVEQMLKDKVKKLESVEKRSENSSKNGVVDPDDPILEMIDLTDDIEERKDAKRAEDKIKDKLAAAAREKLASVTRDRALQLERKKKAAAFLKLKSVESDTRTVEVRREERLDEKVLIISDSENKSDNLDERLSSRSKSKNADKHSKRKTEESDSEEGEIKKRKKSSKKKKSHKRKRSKGRRSSRSRQHKKSKKRKRSETSDSSSE